MAPNYAASRGGVSLRSLASNKAPSSTQSLASDDTLVTPLAPTPAPAASSKSLVLKETEYKPFQERTIKCSYEDCEQRFETLKGMQRHKKYDANHHYCKRCDIDFDSWEELKAHKIEDMAPFVEGKKEPTPEHMPKHIVCEFCGMDFKSFGGRKIHRDQMHKAEQNVHCPGCDTVFIRAANMIEHIEKDHCSQIRAIELYNNIQKTHVMKQVMQNPGQFTKNLNANQLSGLQYAAMIEDGTGRPEHDQEEADDEDDQEVEEHEAGGVALIDAIYEEQQGGIKPLQPEVGLIQMEAQKTEDRSWPNLPRQKSQGLSQAMRNMSLSSGHDHRRGSTAGSDASAVQSTRSGSVWGGKTTSKALFPFAKPTPPPQAGKYDDIVLYAQEAEAANSETNISKVRFWDPNAKEYDPKSFYNAFVGKYVCPFVDCSSNGLLAEYETLEDVQTHIALAHELRVYKCSTCHKRFRSVAGLVAHLESTNKCGVRDSSSFNKVSLVNLLHVKIDMLTDAQFLSDMTGGFLAAREKHVPKIYRPGKELVKSGQTTGGIQRIEYIGKVPDE